MDKWMSKILARGPVRRGEPPFPPPAKAAPVGSPRSCKSTPALPEAPASSPRGSKAPASSPRGRQAAATGRTIGESPAKEGSPPPSQATASQMSPCSSPKNANNLKASPGPLPGQILQELRSLPREATVKEDSQTLAASPRAASGATAWKADIPEDQHQQLSTSNISIQAVQPAATVADVRRLVTAPFVQAEQRPVVVHPTSQPLVVQAAEARLPIQQPAESTPASLPSFSKGEAVHIWSNSQNSWMTDGMITEVVIVPRLSDGPSPPAGVMIPAGAIRVSSSAGLKWIMPEMISTQIRKPIKSAFSKGDKVHVWSNSVNTWMTDGVVLEVCSSPLCSEGGSVPAGTIIPVGAVRVASSAGMKWIMPDLIGIHLRKAADETLTPLTIVEGVKPQLMPEAVAHSVQRQTTALPTADEVGPTVMSLPKRVIRADSFKTGAAAPPARQRGRSPAAAAATLPTPSKALTQPKTVLHSSAHQHGSSTPTQPKALPHSGAHQNGSSTPLAGPTILALPKMVVQPESMMRNGLDAAGLAAPLAANGPTVMALPQTAMPVGAPSKGAEPLSMSNALGASGPTVLAVPKMVSPVSPDRGPDVALGPSNPTVMALPNAADVLKASTSSAQVHTAVEHHSRNRSAIPQLPVAPNVMPPIQPGTEWFNLERQPEMSQRLNRANELQQRLMSERQGMGYPMTAMPEAPQFAAPQVPKFEFSCSPPPGPAGPDYQLDFMAPEPRGEMWAPVGAYAGGNVGNHPYTLRVLTSNGRWEELYFSAADDMEEVGAIFLATHGLKDAFLAGLVDAMRGLVASGQAERSVDVIDLL